MCPSFYLTPSATTFIKQQIYALSHKKERDGKQSRKCESVKKIRITRKKLKMASFTFSQNSQLKIHHVEQLRLRCYS